MIEDMTAVSWNARRRLRVLHACSGHVLAEIWDWQPGACFVAWRPRRSVWTISATPATF